MAKEKPLYEDEQIKITIADTPEDHLLYLKDLNKKKCNANYLIPLGCLKDFAHIPRGKLESRLYNISPEMVVDIKYRMGNVDGIHIAFCQAYMEDEERIRREIKNL